MLNDIPQKRLLVYLIIVGTLPFLLTVAHFYSHHTEISALLAKVEKVQEAAVLKEGKLSTNKQVRHYFDAADHFYLGKNIESLSLRSEEIANLEQLLTHEAMAENETVKKRLEKLSSEQNKIAFTEGSVRSYASFQETTETLISPAEVSIKDVTAILSLVEGIQIGDTTPPDERPQLIITDFKLEKKPSFNDKDSLFIQLKLLKREFL